MVREPPLLQIQQAVAPTTTTTTPQNRDENTSRGQTAAVDGRGVGQQETAARVGLPPSVPSDGGDDDDDDDGGSHRSGRGPPRGPPNNRRRVRSPSPDENLRREQEKREDA